MKSRVKSVEWIILYAVAGIIDLVQIILDFFPPLAAVNAGSDFFIGATFFGYFMIRGVNMVSHWDRTASLLGVTVLDAITGGLAPFWILDIWYIRRSVKTEDTQDEEAESNQRLLRSSQRPLYEGGIRRPVPPAVRSGPANQGGIRSAGPPPIPPTAGS